MCIVPSKRRDPYCVGAMSNGKGVILTLGLPLLSWE